MPYTVSSSGLPKKVKKMPLRLRKVWVSAYNEAITSHTKDESFQIAFAAVRRPRRGNAMEKAVNVGQFQQSARNAFYKAFPQDSDSYDEYLWVSDVFDSYLVVGSREAFFQVPFTFTSATAEGVDQEFVTDFVFETDREKWVSVAPTYATFKMTKQEDGATRWLAVTSGSVEDLDGELVSPEFLKSAVDMADQLGDRGPLLLWHIPSARIGSCDYQAVIGDSPVLLLESGTFDQTPIAEKALEYLDLHAPEMGASIKFICAKRTQDGVFEGPGLILERSLLPRADAAFPWSGLVLQEFDKMTATIDERKLAGLRTIVGDDLAEGILQAADEALTTLKGAGIRFKSKNGEGTEGEAPGTPPTPVQPGAEVDSEGGSELEMEPLLEGTLTGEVPLVDATREHQLILDGVAFASLTEKVAKAVGELNSETFSKFQQQLDELSAQLMDNQKTEEDRIAEKVRNLPRATIRYIENEFRPTQKGAKDASDKPPTARTMAEMAHETLYGPEAGE